MLRLEHRELLEADLVGLLAWRGRRLLALATFDESLVTVSELFELELCLALFETTILDNRVCKLNLARVNKLINLESDILLLGTTPDVAVDDGTAAANGRVPLLIMDRSVRNYKLLS